MFTQRYPLKTEISMKSLQHLVHFSKSKSTAHITRSPLTLALVKVPNLSSPYFQYAIFMALVTLTVVHGSQANLINPFHGKWRDFPFTTPPHKSAFSPSFLAVALSSFPPFLVQETSFTQLMKSFLALY